MLTFADGSAALNKLISIVIPAYNAGSYLAETVETVLQQTCTNWELIIVDDGSTDHTAEVAKGFLGDPRIRYEKQKNSGVSVARNYGASFARGAYIAFLDADDLWQKTYLEKKLRFLESNPGYGMVVGHIRVIDPLSKPDYVFYLGISADAIRSTVEFRDFYSAHPSNIFCRKSDYDKTQGFAPEISNSADKMFYIDFARVARIGSIDEIMVFYRVHPQNMHRNLSLMISDFQVFLRLLRERKVFENREQERLCAVKIYRICAGGSLLNRNIPGFFYYLAIAFLSNPAFMFRDIFSRDRLRNMVFSFLFKTGLGKLMLRNNRKHGRIPILLFHRITPEVDYLYPPVQPDALNRMIAFLGRHYRFISLEDLLNKPAGENRDAACIVFDDGFSDFYHFALPILEKYKAPVSLFLPVENIRKHEVIWTSQLDNALSNTPVNELRTTIGDAAVHYLLDSEKARYHAARDIRSRLMQLPSSEFPAAFAALKEKLGYRESLDNQLLNSEQLDEIRTRVSLQSHTMTHRYLPALKEEEVEDELRESKAQLEKITEAPVRFLSYPIGGYNAATKKIAAQYYDASFAVNNRGVELSRLGDAEYRQEIPRFNIQNKSMYEVFFRINGFHRFFGR